MRLALGFGRIEASNPMRRNLCGAFPTGAQRTIYEVFNCAQPLILLISGLHKAPNMQGTFLVVDERFEEFDSKKGRQKVRRLALLDRAKPALLNTVDYEPKGDDATKLPEGQSVGKEITLGIRDVQQGFGGRLRIDAVYLHNGSAPEVVKSPAGK